MSWRRALPSSRFGSPLPEGRRRRWPAAATLQAGYYAASGVVPLVAYRAFEAITGPKREPWLVKTVGLLTMAIGVALASDRHGRTPVGRTLGMSAATAYLLVDTWYAGVRRRISPVYLIDAAAEAALLGMWLFEGRRLSASGARAPSRRRRR